MFDRHHKNIACVLMCAGIVFLFIWHLLFCVVTVKGNSMYPSLRDGDKVLIFKTKRVNRGDVVLVNVPSKISMKGCDRLCLKRVIALPGDVVYADDGRWLNKTTGRDYLNPIMSKALRSVSLDELTERYGVFTSVFPYDEQEYDIKNSCERVIPYSGMLKMRTSFYSRALDYESREISDNSHLCQTDCCFIVGDNVFDSRDSRYYGPVPFAEVKGKVVCRIKNNSDRELEKVLRMAGTNRAELEKVLLYCKNDELKYRSAVYLIKNMPGHFSYSLSGEDELLKNGLAKMYKVGRVSSEGLMSNIKCNRRKLYDVENITSSFLNENIDAAVTAYRERPWNRTLPFEDFCELLLPYRVGTEPLQSWRSQYKEKYSYILDSLYLGSDPIEAVNSVYNSLNGQLFMYYPSFNLPNLGPEFFMENRIGGCREICDFTLYLLRALGLPVATDFYNQQNIHSWNVVRDINGEYVQFLFDRFGGNEAVRGGGDGRTKGKVWRQHFSSPYVIDVTSDYFPENVYKVKCCLGLPGRRVGLGMFVNAHWYSVFQGVSSVNSVSYYNIEPGTVYIAIDEQNKTISYPFVPQFDGAISYFEPDVKKLRNVVVKRKLRVTNYLRSRMKEVDGTTLWGLDDDSGVMDHLGSLYSSISNDEVLDVNGGEYDYLIIKPNQSGYVCLAELMVISDDGSIVEYQGASEMCDGDPLSYYEQSGSVALRFKRRSKIKTVVWTPKNDDNFVRVGDRYELFYQNGKKGWVSLGVQEAKSNSLVYENAPSNALFWLHNKDRGRAEEVFYINDEGEQVFL